MSAACARIQTNGDSSGEALRKKLRVSAADDRQAKVTVVLGAQWGDEGKGKVVDMLATDADIVCRCQVLLRSAQRLSSPPPFLTLLAVIFAFRVVNSLLYFFLRANV